MIEQASTNDPLAALRAQPEKKTKGRGRAQMGQADFIKLMVAQMKNQDPTKPMDPNAFMGQLAQFSTVNGIEELKKSVDAMVSRMAMDQSVKAANLVGHEVMAPGNDAQLAAGGKVTGKVKLDSSTTDLTIRIYSNKGALVRTLPMGMYSSGPVSFTWDGFREDGKAAPPGSYRVVAEALVNDKTVRVPVQISSRVQSVNLNGQGGELTLNLANGHSVPLSAVDEIL